MPPVGVKEEIAALLLRADELTAKARELVQQREHMAAHPRLVALREQLRQSASSK